MSTLIVTAAPTAGGEEARGRYLQGVLPLLMGAGGTPLKRLRVTNTVVGDAGTGIVLVMDFDNAESTTDVLAGDEYQALIADRDQAFSTMQILITEDMPASPPPAVKPGA